MCYKYIQEEISQSDIPITVNLQNITLEDVLEDISDESLAATEEFVVSDSDSDSIADSEYPLSTMFRQGMLGFNINYYLNIYEEEIKDKAIVHLSAYLHKSTDNSMTFMCHQCFLQYASILTNINSLNYSSTLVSYHLLYTGDLFHGSVGYDIQYDGMKEFFCYDCSRFLYNVTDKLSEVSDECECKSEYQNSFEGEGHNFYTHNWPVAFYGVDGNPLNL
uniref:NS3 n=1 Tax=uncultured densovirus TaxID=748192 RepID=A0A7M4CBK5_9VIRU|nr:NS3 [uncultured densovirus]